MGNRVTGETGGPGEQWGQEERGNRGKGERGEWGTGKQGNKGERANRGNRGNRGNKGGKGNRRKGIIVVCPGTSWPKICFDLIDINIVLTNKRFGLCKVQNGTRNEQQENNDLHYTTKSLATRKYFTARNCLADYCAKPIYRK